MSELSKKQWQADPGSTTDTIAKLAEAAWPSQVVQRGAGNTYHEEAEGAPKDRIDLDQGSSAGGHGSILKADDVRVRPEDPENQLGPSGTASPHSKSAELFPKSSSKSMSPATHELVGRVSLSLSSSPPSTSPAKSRPNWNGGEDDTARKGEGKLAWHPNPRGTPKSARSSPSGSGSVLGLDSIRSQEDAGSANILVGMIPVDTEDEMLRGLDAVYVATAGDREKRKETFKVLARQRSLVDALVRTMCKYGKQVRGCICKLASLFSDAV